MRPLDSFERDLARKIAERQQGTTLPELLRTCLNEVCIEIESSHRTAHAVTKESDAHNFEKNGRLEELYRKVICTVNLFELLQEEKYIIVAQTLKEPENYRLGCDGFSEKTVSYRIRDDEVVSMLINYLNRKIYPTQALADYVTNKFKTDEEVKHRKEVIGTWVGIAVAGIFGVAGIFLTVHYQSQYNRSIDIANEQTKIAQRNAEAALAGNKIRLAIDFRRQERALYERMFKEPDLMAFVADPLPAKKPFEIADHYITILLNDQEAKTWTSEYKNWGTVENLLNILFQPLDFHNPAKVKLRKAYDMGELLLYLLQDVYGAHLSNQIEKVEFDTWVPYFDDCAANPFFLTPLCFGHSSGYISRDFARFCKDRIERNERNRKVVEVVYPDMLKTNWIERIGQRGYDRFIAERSRGDGRQ